MPLEPNRPFTRNKPEPTHRLEEIEGNPFERWKLPQHGNWDPPEEPGQ
jgi:hypothetical protein